MYSITILGAYGAKSEEGGSSAFFLNDKHVIDAGNLLVPLKEKSVNIETIWLTHSHLDHIVDIAYIIDNYYEKRKKTLVLRGLPATLTILKKHFFNHTIWADFANIPLSNGNEGMSLSYEPIVLNQKYDISEGMSLRTFQTDHTVPSCGYVISKLGHSVLISADTYSLSSVIETVNADTSIKTMVIECSFPSKFVTLAKESKHLTPALLFEGLLPLGGKGIKLYVNHLKPSYVDVIKEEIEALKGQWDVSILTDGDKIYF